MTVARGEQADAEGVFDALIVAHEGGQKLGEIERAASADANDASGIGCAGARKSKVKGGDGGFVCWSAVNRDAAACSE